MPSLPGWLPDIELHHLRVGYYSLSICFWREGDHSRWEVREMQADKILCKKTPSKSWMSQKQESNNNAARHEKEKWRNHYLHVLLS